MAFFNGLADSRFLAAAKIQRIIEDAAPLLARSRPLTFLDRLKMVDAEDDELMGRLTTKVYAADIIGDDGIAGVYQGGSIELVLNSLAKFKAGAKFNEKDLKKFAQLERSGGYALEQDDYRTWIQRLGENLLLGVRQAQNAAAAGMYLDNLDYNRLGIKISGSVWGMPANLKLTASPAWSSDGGTTVNASATPISDLIAFDKIDADNYGLGNFDRWTMSTTAFDFMVSTTEFANKAFLQLGAGFAPSLQALMTKDRGAMLNVLQGMTHKTIVLDDATYTRQNADGSEVTTRVFPANKVILDRTTNGPSEVDFGNGIVTESIVSGMLGPVTMAVAGAQMQAVGVYGPLSYITANQDLNPPSVTSWAVSRGWPRKHRPESSALLTAW